MCYSFVKQWKNWWVGSNALTVYQADSSENKFVWFQFFRHFNFHSSNCPLQMSGEVSYTCCGKLPVIMNAYNNIHSIHV